MNLLALLIGSDYCDEMTGIKDLPTLLAGLLLGDLMQGRLLLGGMLIDALLIGIFMLLMASQILFALPDCHISMKVSFLFSAWHLGSLALGELGTAAWLLVMHLSLALGELGTAAWLLVMHLSLALGELGTAAWLLGMLLFAWKPLTCSWCIS